eukprot:m.256691 g.256691  ORF g.256691 m.256691 type:complete len:135 (-) comp34587_c0_seq1:351-755(-)
MASSSYAYSTEVTSSYTDAITLTKEALKKEGFGVLTEIDMQKTMKAKIDKDMKPYVILGACKPTSAWAVLQLEEQIGLFLPCNVTVLEKSPGVCVVSAINPVSAMSVIGNDAIVSEAKEVAACLSRVVASLGSK